MMKLYTTQDGDIWGFWCEGHIDILNNMSSINAELNEEGFLSVGPCDVVHTWATHDNDLDSEYNFVECNSDDEGAIPITMVRGDDVCYS